MIQEIIVGMIGLIVLGIIIYRVYLFFFEKDQSKGACGCASCHCSVSKKAK